MFRRTHVLSAGMALLAAGVLAAGCSSNSASPGNSGSNAPVTIKVVLPPNTGPITAADNAGLLQLTQQYEKAHKNVTVQWLPNDTGSISAANAAVESQASGGAAPTWAQFIADLGRLKAAGITPFMFTDGNANCTPSWWERLATSSLLASQVSQFDVNHTQVTNGLDNAVGIKKGIIGMSNPRYAEA